MADRRRILLAVEPLVLGDALATVLTAVGLDEVLLSVAKGADGTPMHVDAAIVTDDATDVVADVIVYVAPGRTAHITGTARDERVALRTPQELLSILDRYCPTTAPRVAAPDPNGALR